MKEKKFEFVMQDLCELIENEKFTEMQKAEIKGHINLWLK